MQQVPGDQKSADLYWDSSLTLGAETEALTRLIWPKCLIEPTDIPENNVKFEASGEAISRVFPVWGLRRQDNNQLIAFASGAVINAPIESSSLPMGGWTFAIESGMDSVIEAVSTAVRPNCLCLLTANVHPNFNNLGLSVQLLERGKELARQLGFDAMIGPVRPTLKSSFQDISTEEYLTKKTTVGEIFDPWLRRHVQCGAEILNICVESFVVVASVAKWSEWLGQEICVSGNYRFSAGLFPVRIDVPKNQGVYREENIWVKYRL